MPRLQQTQRRFLPRLFGSNDAGGDYPDAYAAGSARGTGICGEHARPQDAVHGRLRDAIPYVERKFGEEAGRFAYWLDFFTLDSQYDYDPVWAKCVELKVVPGFHSQGFWGGRASPSNFVYNHIGHFAAAGEAMCRGLFMGGVTRRFPSLKFAFLECGVGWGVTLYSDLIGHWEKRNIKAMGNYDPANLDEELFVDLCRKYGGRT